MSGRDPTDNGQVGQDHQPQDQKSADAHGPSEADLWDQPFHHDGEDDAAERRAGSGDAQGQRAPFEEPAHHGGHGRVEDHRCSQGAAYPLGQKELVVCFRDGGHHETEDVEEGSPNQEVAWAVVVWIGASVSRKAGCKQDRDRICLREPVWKSATLEEGVFGRARGSA